MDADESNALPNENFPRWRSSPRWPRANALGEDCQRGRRRRDRGRLARVRVPVRANREV